MLVSLYVYYACMYVRVRCTHTLDDNDNLSAAFYILYTRPDVGLYTIYYIMFFARGVPRMYVLCACVY